MKIGKVTRFDERRPILLSEKPRNRKLMTVLIRRSVVHDMYKHAATEMYHEVGGYLLGFPAIDIWNGVEVTFIDRAIRAIYDSTPTHITLDPTSFREIDLVREKEDTILVGYYHSHPGLSVFMSGTDIANFESYHPEPYQVSIVIDPSRASDISLENLRDWLGFFVWDENKIIKLPEQNLIITNDRPDIVWRIDKILLEQAINVAGVFANINIFLQESTYKFDSRFPVIVIPQAVNDILLERRELSEGLLYGAIHRIGNNDFLVISTNYPFTLDWLLRNRNIKKKKIFSEQLNHYEHHYTTINSPNEVLPIGCYFDSSRVRLFNRITSLLKSIARDEVINLYRLFFRPYFLIAIKEHHGIKKGLNFLVWSYHTRKCVKLPKNQILIIEQANDGQIS